MQKPTRRNRSRRTCTRYKTVGRLTQNALSGSNTKPFSGRLKGRKLKPGRYRAKLTATDAAANRSNTATARFRIARG